MKEDKELLEIEKEEQEQVKKENEETFKEYRLALLENLPYLVMILVGLGVLISFIILKKGYYFGSLIVSLGFGGMELKNYLHEKRLIYMLSFILWYVVSTICFVCLFI